MQSKKTKAELLEQLADYYSRKLSDTQSLMFLEDLENYSVAHIEQAIIEYRLDPTNRMFPYPSQLIALMRPMKNVQDDPLMRKIKAHQLATRKPYCQKCTDLGTIRAAEINPPGHKYLYTFACTCELGSRFSAYQKWDFSLTDRYKIC